jgi:hypothetical protein
MGRRLREYKGLRASAEEPTGIWRQRGLFLNGKEEVIMIG